MAPMLSHRLTRNIHPFFRVRPARIPVYLLFLVATYTLYHLLVPESAKPASLSHLDAHLRDWKRYPSVAGGRLGEGNGAKSGSGLIGSADAVSSAGIAYGETEGLARGWQLTKGKRIQHPIEILIEQGQKRWKSLLGRQSKSLEAAVEEYQRRYRRPPPRGFDKWWKFAMENDVKIVDDVSAALRGRWRTCLADPSPATPSPSTTRSTTILSPTLRCPLPCSKRASRSSRRRTTHSAFESEDCRIRGEHR